MVKGELWHEIHSRFKLKDTKTAWIRAREKAELPKTFRFHALSYVPRREVCLSITGRGEVSLPGLGTTLNPAYPAPPAGQAYV